MGLLLSRIASLFHSSREVRVLMLGIDNAGKTTILYRMQLGNVVETVPSKD
jgi:ADP-ribosylation factor-like protein 1